jgi:hypothetical protein
MGKTEKILLVLTFSICLTVVALNGSYCQSPTQTPLTKDQIELRLKNVQIEKRYLELQVEEQTLQQALANMAKPEAKKEEKKAK